METLSGESRESREVLLGKTEGAAAAASKHFDPAQGKPLARASNPLHDQVYCLQDSGKEILDISLAARSLTRTALVRCEL